MKYADSAMAAKYSGAADYFETASAAILEMFRQTGPYEIGEDGLMKRGVIIRHLILPGHVMNSLRVLKWVEEHFKPGDVMFSLMHQYIPCGRVSETEFPELNRRITRAEYRRVESALMESSIEDGYLQIGGIFGRNPFRRYISPFRSRKILLSRKEREFHPACWTMMRSLTVARKFFAGTGSFPNLSRSSFS